MVAATSCSRVNDLLGAGETTLRRAQQRGLFATEARALGRRASMRVLRREALEGVRAALCAAGVGMEAEALSAEQMAQALGIDLGRLQYLEKRGVLPKGPRTSQGHAAYREEDVARYRAALDALADEDPVAEVNAEGWLTRAQAAEWLGISLRELGRRVAAGKLVAHEERIRGRVRVVFWGADVLRVARREAPGPD